MAGFHVLYRQTNEQIYNAVEGELQLPKNLSADMKSDTKPDKDGNYGDKEICPEFFFGMYKSIGKDDYGLDAGIVYMPSGKFKLFIFGFDTTIDKKDAHGNSILWSDIDINVRAGDKVYLELFLIPNRIYILVKNPNGGNVISRLFVPLTQKAFDAFHSGCYINRESVMASNLLDNRYAPSRAYFSDATWRNTKITLAETNEVIHLTEQNSYRKKSYDDYGSMPKKFAYGGYTVTEPGNDGLGDFVADVSSADCR